jgi:hypothetical protein
MPVKSRGSYFSRQRSQNVAIWTYRLAALYMAIQVFGYRDLLVVFCGVVLLAMIIRIERRFQRFLGKS